MRLIILFLFIWTTALKAELSININYKYYLINTTSVNFILSDLNNASPINKNGETYHGHTDTNISWNFLWKIAYGKCRIDRVTTNVDITYTLPKLTKKYRNKKLLLIWNKWYPALVKHEKKHAIYAIDTANKIEREIKSIWPHSNCKELENTANKSANKLIKRLNKIDKKYDEVTGHGKSEGASIITYL